MSNVSTTDQPMLTEIRHPMTYRQFANDSATRRRWHNVGHMERIVGATAAAGFIALGLNSKSVLNKIIFMGLGGAMLHRSLTGRCAFYKALGLSTAQEHPARPEDYFQRGLHVETSQTINATSEKLYRFWRDFSNLPRIMRHLKSVETLSTTRSRWTAAAPLHTSAFWEAEIIHDVPNELISWNSVEKSDVENAGTVIFSPLNDRQTEVRVVLDYIPPAGKIGDLLAHMFGEAPDQTIQEDLRRFKMLMEAGGA
jgi:uncharacterized membrane protein